MKGFRLVLAAVIKTETEVWKVEMEWNCFGDVVKETIARLAVNFNMWDKGICLGNPRWVG